jgi:hypothetical protein
MLLDNGANPDMPDLNGTIPLLLAKKLNNLIGHDMLLSLERRLSNFDILKSV